MNTVILGAVAGAAGTMALDMTTYADMALRGRPSSNLPAEIIRIVAGRAGLETLAKPAAEAGESIGNRRTGLGALSGYFVGLAIGASYGVTYPVVRKLPVAAKALILGGVAMAASAVPATTLGATDPKTWGVSGWLADIVPHLLYGVVTAVVFESIISAV